IQGNDLRRLERLWPDGFVLYQSQVNHFGGITLLVCGPGASSYCTMHAPERTAAANVGEAVIVGNVIRDSNLEGIMLLTDTGAVANFAITDTIVRDLSLKLPRPESLTPPAGLLRSRAFTLISLNHSTVHLTDARAQHGRDRPHPGGDRVESADGRRGEQRRFDRDSASRHDQWRAEYRHD